MILGSRNLQSKSASIIFNYMTSGAAAHKEMISASASIDSRLACYDTGPLNKSYDCQRICYITDDIALSSE